MSVSYNNTVKDARMNVVLSAIDANASPATLEICTAGYAAVLSTITLAKPSFSEASQTLTLLGTPRTDLSAAGAGTPAVARIKDGGGTVVVNSLTVTATGGGGDIQIGSTVISVGEQVSCTSGTITHAA